MLIQPLTGWLLFHTVHLKRLSYLQNCKQHGIEVCGIQSLGFESGQHHGNDSGGHAPVDEQQLHSNS